MEDQFEHQIADQVSGFQLTPNAQVWKGVVLELDKEKNKRSGLIWWMPLGILGLGIAGWFWYHATQVGTKPTVQTMKKSSQNILPNLGTTTKDSSSTDAILDTTLGASIISTKEPIQKQQTTIDQISKTLLVQEIPEPQKPQESKTTTASSTTKSFDSSEVFKQTNTNNNLDHQGTKNKEESRSTRQTINKEDSHPIIQTIVSENSTKKDSNISSVPTLSFLTKKPIKSSWRFQVAIGSTRLTATNLLGNSVAADRAAFANNSSAIVSGFPNTTVIESSKKGFHAELGLSKNWVLSKRWELTIGWSYRYLQNQQMTGLKKDSSYLISSQASSNNKAVTVNNYYLPGSQNNMTNRAHWLMLPIQIHFNLNPSSKPNWLVFSGTNLYWNFSSHWLVQDQANNILYEARPLTNLLGIHAQLGIQIRNQKSQSLSLGWEKSMNSMSKLNQSKQYWNQLQLQFSQPIYLKKSSKK